MPGVIDAKQILVVGAIGVKRCGLTYGQAPCTANLPAGQECYNSYPTCQDKANFDLVEDQRVLIASNTMDSLTTATDTTAAVPTIVGFPKHTPTKIKRGKGVAERGKCKVICQDWYGPDNQHNYPIDKYAATRSPDSKRVGTFWGQFKARFQYYYRNIVQLSYWRINPATATPLVGLLAAQDWHIESIDGPDKSGKVTLNLRDILSSIDIDTSQAPPADAANLVSNINSAATSFNIQNYDAALWPASNGHMVIDEEFISYSSFNSTTGLISGATRGAGGTTKASHSAGDRTQFAIYWNQVNVVNVMYSLLVNYAGIDTKYIPYDISGADPTQWWNQQKDTYLAGYNVTRLLYNPVGVGTLLDELCEQCNINLWHDPDLNQILISAHNTAIAAQKADVLDEQEMLVDTIDLREVDKEITTQAWVYYGQMSLVDDDDPATYTGLIINTNTDLESANALGRKRVRAVLGNWLQSGQNIAIITAFRWIQEDDEPRYELTFQVDYDKALRTGQFLNIRSRHVQNPDGTPRELTWQIVSRKDVVPTARLEIKAVSVRPTPESTGLRFANIVNVANESVEYGDALQADRDAWGWIAALDGFENDDDPYSMS